MMGLRAGVVVRPRRVEVFAVRRAGWVGKRISSVVSEPIPEPEPSAPAVSPATGRPAATPDRQAQEAQAAAVAQAIRTALARAGVTSVRLGISVASPDLLLRSFAMPLLPKPERGSAMQFEARRYVPFKLNELVWAFHQVDDQQANHLRVAFVSMRTEALARLHRAVADAGGMPAFVEPQSVSLARLLGVPHPASRGPAFLDRLPWRRSPHLSHEYAAIVELDEEAGVAHLVIAREQVPYFARDVLLTFPPAPSDPHRLPEAPPMPPAPSDVQPQPREPGGSTVADSRIEVLASELRISFEFFAREHPNAGIRELVVFGDPTTVEPWVRELNGHLSCPVSAGRPPRELEDLAPSRLAQATAMGLALRALRRRIVRMDLPVLQAGKPVQKALSWEALKHGTVDLSQYLQPALLRQLAKTAALQLATAVVALGVLAGIGRYQVASARHQMRQHVAAFPDAGHGLSGVPRPELEALQQRLEQRLAFLGRAIEGRIWVTEKLDLLAKALPEGIWLEGLDYRQESDRSGQGRAALTVKGACFLAASDNELDTIRGFVERIRKDQRFLEGLETAQLAHISEARDQPRHVYQRFQMECGAGRRL
jgi:Tfp pilus assembly PilM family ATPase